MGKTELTKIMRWKIADSLAKDRLEKVNLECKEVHPRTTIYSKYIKRMFDILLSAIALIITLPINLILGIVTFFDVGNPIFFRQERIGKDGKIFEIIKFRNMKNTTDERGELLSPEKRVTKFGHFVRKTSLDELLNFWSVFKGDMSLIGPRPERTQFVEQFKEEIPRYMVKHQVRPGLTGWAQVNGYRGDTSIRKRIDCDLYYVENWTLGLDFKILIMTFFKGFVNKNAY